MAQSTELACYEENIVELWGDSGSYNQVNHPFYFYMYNILAEVPGVAREIKKLILDKIDF